jgi:hypothetical protein
VSDRADWTLEEWVASFYADPLGFVMFAFPWNTDPAIQMARLPEPWASRYGVEFGPDAWACQLLDDLGEQVRLRGFDGVRPVLPIRMAVASGHGIGKSTLTGWLVNWIMSTRPFCRGTVTANTSIQLETKTWKEITIWTKRSITAPWFNLTAGRGSMKMTHVDFPDSWYCTAQTSREENSESFAGQHAANSTSFYIFDEASAIPDQIAEVAEGGLTDGEPMFFKFGNPTRNSGDFHAIFNDRALSSRWLRYQIDSRDCQVANKTLINQWIEDYGLDSDFCKIRVRGMFPSMSAKQFISTADVDAAFGRVVRPEQYDFAPKILTCDPAWEGDDELVIGLRQGLAFQILKVMEKNDNDIHVAGILAQMEDEHEADAVFIDMGYGTGIVSAGRTMNRNWTAVSFAGQSSDPGCLNKRAEMWKLMRDWLKEGGCLPAKDYELYKNLCQPETVPRMDGKIQLESKESMKKRKLSSPNRGDALALSFAFPVRKKTNLPRPAATNTQLNQQFWGQGNRPNHFGQGPNFFGSKNG